MLPGTAANWSIAITPRCRVSKGADSAAGLVVEAPDEVTYTDIRTDVLARNSETGRRLVRRTRHCQRDSAHRTHLPLITGYELDAGGQAEVTDRRRGRVICKGAWRRRTTT
ncbi:hypothetical protein GCM10028799_82800 [Kribbella italica]